MNIYVVKRVSVTQLTLHSIVETLGITVAVIDISTSKFIVSKMLLQTLDALNCETEYSGVNNCTLTDSFICSSQDWEWSRHKLWKDDILYNL